MYPYLVVAGRLRAQEVDAKQKRKKNVIDTVDNTAESRFTSSII